MKKPSRKIFLVDDGTATRASVFNALDESGYDVTCFAHAEACLSELERGGCHLLIADTKAPGMDVMTLLSKAKQIAPWTPVMMISELGDVSKAVEAMRLGAADFMEKPLNITLFVTKVNEILHRHAFDSSSDELKLTKTEKKVLKLILDGCSNKEVAYKMHIALRTVEFHRSNIFRKFGVNNVVDLTKKAIAMFTPGNNKQ
ncbi:MAG: LuxR C-terminal-related transcriptional regulator [Phycisphaerae bacterium]|nr:LuxR C-terminal-related transcriptional regulator [Phycisphaerae bacterium]MDD5380419.1 LuxR C-terminal-related transcriptional regulator [Phycisphaerae bacterium]